MSVFTEGKETYHSDLVLGEKYQDKTTEIEGTLVGLYFYEHACERGCIRYVDNQKRVVETTFDAPELVHVETGKKATSEKTGGPDRGGTRATPVR